MIFVIYRVFRFSSPAFVKFTRVYPANRGTYPHACLFPSIRAHNKIAGRSVNTSAPYLLSHTGNELIIIHTNRSYPLLVKTGISHTCQTSNWNAFPKRSSVRFRVNSMTQIETFRSRASVPGRNALRGTFPRECISHFSRRTSVILAYFLWKEHWLISVKENYGEKHSSLSQLCLRFLMSDPSWKSRRASKRINLVYQKIRDIEEN